jgi:hypothetical protein
MRNTELLKQISNALIDINKNLFNESIGHSSEKTDDIEYPSYLGQAKG